MADRISELFRRALSVISLILLALPLGVTHALDFATVPLFVPGTVSPNLVLTLDDSGSMRWAFVPDLCEYWASSGQEDRDKCHDQDGVKPSILHTRRFKSSDFNPLYFNPTVTYTPPVGNAGTALSTSFDEAYINGFAPDRGSVNLGTAYRPTASYDPSAAGTQVFAKHPAGDFINGDAGTAAYYYVFKSDLANCDKTKEDEDCYEKLVVGDSEKQNFANWYSFYRTRNLATVSAASLAFDKVPKDFRVAWQALSSCKDFTGNNCQNWAGNNKSNAINRMQGTHRDTFYEWVHKLPAHGGTPLRSAMRRAGEYFKLSGANNPYDNALGDASDNTEHTCRPNYHVLMTDGMWNDFDSEVNAVPDASITISNYDNSLSTPLGEGGTYTARAPFSDGNSLSLADIALYYWATDLRGNLTNNLAPYLPFKAGKELTEAEKWDPRNDPATWQHMVNFTVGLGLGQSLGKSGLTWGGDTYSGSYAELKAGTKSWPTTSLNDVDNVSDLWHAAINSRGQFFNSDDPRSLTSAFESILRSIESKSIRASAASQNTSQLSTDTFIYQASFDGSDWSGTLTAYKLDAKTGAIESTAWEAHKKLPDYASRDIFTWKPTVGGVEFRYDQLSADQQVAMDIDQIVAPQVVNYLRGDGSLEGATYRSRANKLGDIVNSDPLFVGDTDHGYEALPEDDSGASTYLDFVFKDKPKRDKMVYVGANDGMLHGFKASDGVEAFAYMPNAAILAQDANGTYRLQLLKNNDYNHRFFVDGSPFAGDAYIAPGGTGSPGWKTVLVSGMGAGGRAVFALDVTKPETFTADNVLWEFSHFADANLGYTFGQPIIVRLNNGRWAAVFGNGYPDDTASSTATAKLFIVYLDANAKDGWDLGTDYRVLSTSDQTGNGLSTPIWLDIHKDRVTDFLYAGDLKGNVWKFDLSAADPTKWGVAYKDGSGNPQPLFTARNADGTIQPITAALELGAKEAGVRDKPMVYFGTGQFMAKGDNDVTGAPTQSFYGIYDNGSPVDMGDPPARDSKLREQTITELKGQTFGSATFDVRFTTDHLVNYAGGERGWYMDLPTLGERVVSHPLLRHGRVIFVTLIPSLDPCLGGGDSWLMEVNAVNGDLPDTSVFDLNDDQAFDTVDMVTYGDGKVPVSGLKSPVGIIDTPAVVTSSVPGGCIEYKVSVGENGAPLRIPEACTPVRSGRVSWREVIE